MDHLASSPQLVMWRDHLDDLPPVELPEGYSIQHYRPGLHAAWDDIIGKSFQCGDCEGRFFREIRHDNPFRPERVMFVFHGEKPVATASAFYRPHFGKNVGYLHYVGVVPEAAGRNLGLQVSLACLHKMKQEGRTEAVLQTDDFRIPAVKIYLKLGFRPCLVHENQRDRWRRVFETIDRPELIEEFKNILEGPIFEMIPVRPDNDSPENFRLRHKWHPNREHRGGRRGGGDMDFMGDESLYRPSRLGTATVSPTEVVAGTEMEEPLTLTYTAGPAGLPEGASVLFAMRGQSPLGFRLSTENPDDPGNLDIRGPSDCKLEPKGVGFRVVGGTMKEGSTVTLTLSRPEELRWTPLAGRREFKVVIDPGGVEPEQRLESPLVITVLPREFDHLEATMPCTRRKNEPVRVLITARDNHDNRVPLHGHVVVGSGRDSQRFALTNGLARGEFSAPGDGPVRAQVTLEGLAKTCESNVSIVSMESDDLQLYIGDLHCHDFLSEAEGYPDQVYQWAREDRNLDFVSVVPQSHGWHDNETWTICKYMNERFLDEGRFVTFPGFEWQQTGYGDKVIHFLGGDQPYLPVDDGRYNSAPKLYEALRASDALVISHHPAYPPGSWCSHTDFDILEYDVERLLEIWSMHGSSEGYDPTDRPLRNAVEEGLALTALRKGARLGFVAGSDTHSARPGGSAKEPLRYWGGLAAAWAKSLTRRDVFEALYARRTYALTRARIILRMTVNGALMGSEIPAADKANIRIDAWTPGKLKKIELLKNAGLVRTFDESGDECHVEIEDRTGGPAFYHCRVTQQDGELAVCSPVWVG